MNEDWEPDENEPLDPDEDDEDEPIDEAPQIVKPVAKAPTDDELDEIVKTKSGLTLRELQQRARRATELETRVPAPAIYQTQPQGLQAQPDDDEVITRAEARQLAEAAKTAAVSEARTAAARAAESTGLQRAAEERLDALCDKGFGRKIKPAFRKAIGEEVGTGFREYCDLKGFPTGRELQVIEDIAMRVIKDNEGDFDRGKKQAARPPTGGVPADQPAPNTTGTGSRQSKSRELDEFGFAGATMYSQRDVDAALDEDKKRYKAGLSKAR